jgi:hypothetical protein
LIVLPAYIASIAPPFKETTMLAVQAPRTGNHAENDMLDDHAAERQRIAYNAAFDELGLNWHWDPITYALLPDHGPAGVRHYLEKEHQHLLRAYDADFLVQAIETAKQRCLDVMRPRRVNQ